MPAHRNRLRPAFLVMLAFVAFAALCQLMTPRITPPGNVWWPGDTLAVAALLAGAFISGWRGLRGYEALILGLFGGSAFGVWWPDGRDYFGMGFGSAPPLEWYLRSYVLFIAAIGLCCGIVAEASRAARRFSVSRSRRRVGKCRGCGYDLRGLPEPRCPECGTPFASSHAPS